MSKLEFLMSLYLWQRKLLQKIVVNAKELFCWHQLLSAAPKHKVSTSLRLWHWLCESTQSVPDPFWLTLHTFRWIISEMIHWYIISSMGTNVKWTFFTVSVLSRLKWQILKIDLITYLIVSPYLSVERCPTEQIIAADSELSTSELYSKFAAFSNHIVTQIVAKQSYNDILPSF